MHDTLTAVKNWKIKYKLGKRHQALSKEFESIYWLPVYKNLHQYINAITFKFINNVLSYEYSGLFSWTQVYEYTPQCRIESKSNFAKLKVPYQKFNMGQKRLSYIGPSLWNNLPGSMKKTTVLNAFKHNLKKQHLGNLAES